MIVMTPHATEGEVAAVRERLETMGLHVLVMPGELTTAIGAIGDPEAVREAGFEGMEGVDRVVPISRPYKLASSRALPRRAERVRHRRPHGRRQQDVLPDRRARARWRRASRR